MPPTEDELRNLAQEIGNELVQATLEDIFLGDLDEKKIPKDERLDYARYYLHGVLTVYIKDEPVTQENIDRYFAILEIPADESAKLLKTSTVTRRS